jgi:hypothetical protein
MRRCLPLLLLFTTALAVAADPPPATKDAKSPTLAPGSDLPGPFHPYNVTGPDKGRYHCLVSEHGLDPLVIVFARNLEADDANGPVMELLTQLDLLIEKNPKARLAAFAVSLSDALPEVVGASLQSDEQRKQTAGKLEALAGARSLKYVVLTLAGKEDVDKYPLDVKADVTVVLADKYRVVKVYALKKDDLKGKIDEVLAEVADKFGAKKK